MKKYNKLREYVILFFLVFFAVVTFSSNGNSIPVSEGTLIPRKVLFSDHNYYRVRISPDGQYLSYLALNNGVPNIYISKLGSGGDFQAVTNYDTKCIISYYWAYDNKHIIYGSDNSGSRNTQIYTVNVETGQIKNLTPFQGAKSELLKISHNFPERILIETNKRDQKYFDIAELNVNTGEMQMIYENHDGYSNLLFDDLYNLRFAHKITNNAFNIYQFDKLLKPNLLLTSSLESSLNTKIIAIPSNGNAISMKDSSNSDIPNLIEWDLLSKKKKTLLKINKGDLSNFLLHPTSKEVQAVAVNYDKERWEVLDKNIENDFQYLQSLNSGVMNVISRTLKDDKWIVCFNNDNSSTLYYLYDRIEKKAKMLFQSNAALDKYKLAKMHPVEIKTRDGLTMLGYLTLPLSHVKTENDQRPTKPLPLILNIHGGPHARDSWYLNREHQLFANRGYAVLSVNYRGSTGFGNKFLKAGNGEWGGKMHLDVIDAANWAVENKIAIKEKIAIYGVSYGGYEALVGLTFTPDFFACGVDVVGPSNLVTLINTKPAYWHSTFSVDLKSLGADKGQDFLKSISPLAYANRIKKPLLIAQGSNDPIVVKAESDQIVEAMKAHGIPVTYILYPDEGHGFSKPKNNQSFYGITELFFAQCLGGQAEPLSDEIEKSSVVFLEGKYLIEGLK